MIRLFYKSIYIHSAMTKLLYCSIQRKKTMAKDDTKSKDTAIEDVRYFWNVRPCNIRHSISEVGTKQYFDEVEKRVMSLNHCVNSGLASK